MNMVRIRDWTVVDADRIAAFERIKKELRILVADVTDSTVIAMYDSEDDAKAAFDVLCKWTCAANNRIPGKIQDSLQSSHSLL